MGSFAQAVDLTWDSSGPGDPAVTDGDGVWNLTDETFFNGTTNVAWTNGNNAIIGKPGTAAAANTPFNLDLSAAIEVQDLTLAVGANGTAYNISDFGGGSLTLLGNISKVTSGLSPTPGQGVFQLFLTNGLTLGAGDHVISMVDSPGDAPAEMTFTGGINGSGGITIDNRLSGSTEAWGTAAFQGANNYAGATNIKFGRLVINDANGLGTTAAGTTISEAGALSIAGAGIAASNVTLNEAITISRSTYTGGEFGRYGAAVISANGSGTTTLSGPFVVDSNDARVAANSSTLIISSNITAGPNATTPMLSVTGDFAGFVKLTGNNTALTGGVSLINAVQLDVENDNQIGGASAPLNFIGGGTYHPVNGYATSFGSHVINNATFNGGINVDDGQTFTINQSLGRAMGSDVDRVGTLGKRGTGTLNINSSVNLRGGQTYWDAGIVNVNVPIELANLHLRSPVVNIGTGGSISMNVGFSSLGQDTTGTNGGPDIAVVNITGTGKLIQTNNEDFNVSDNANTRGTINLSDNGVLTTSGITHLGKNTGAVGTINQSGGALTVQRTGDFAFVVGRNNGTGFYNFSGGTFSSVGEVFVGQGFGDGVSGSGTWTQTGGTATISNWFVIGREGGKGAVDISAGSIIKNGGGNVPIGEGGNNTRTNSFTIRGTGTFDAQTGEVWVSNGNNTTTMTVQDSGVLNVNNYFVVGRFGNSKGFLNLSGNGVINKATSNPFIVAAGGGSQGTVNQTGGAVNNTTTETWIGDGGVGVWNFSGGTNTLGLFDVGHNGGGSGTLNVSGTASLTAGTIRIGEAGTVNGTFNFDGGTVKANEIIARNSSGTKTFNFNGGTLATGVYNVGSGLTNTGTGKVSPGLAVAGSTAITGSYTQGATAFMAIDLGGASAGEFDSVTATGAVSLAGRLDLALLSYDPTLLGAHTIISGSAVTGHFATIGGVIIPSNKRLAVTYTSTAVNVTAARAGDTNLDGSVNFDDLLTLAQNYSSTTSQWSMGDFDGDGATVFDDLLALAQNYGLSGMALPTDLGSSVSSDVAADWALALSMVPEPTSLTFLGLSGLAFSRNRRR